ncbi:serine/threonine-protein phosphatase 7 long form homolog [Carex rostrata]
MDLFGSVMFPDKTMDSVPCMYLQFLRHLDEPWEYNWGSAVLAYLYRELSSACMTTTNSISGPLLLLQMWSWTRFPIGRPKPAAPHLPLGGVDPSERHAFGVKWTTRHIWTDNTHLGGVSHFRDDLSDLVDGAVNWLAYKEHENDWNAQVYKDQKYFMARGALIHFWIVTQHYPDRVMRQYSLYQVVPPPAPEPWEWHKMYNKIKHDKGRASTISRDWRDRHKLIIECQMIIIEESRPWTVDPQYKQWYMSRGMPTMHMTADEQAVLDQPLEDPPQNEVENLSYQPRSCKTARLDILPEIGNRNTVFQVALCSFVL